MMVQICYEQIHKLQKRCFLYLWHKRDSHKFKNEKLYFEQVSAVTLRTSTKQISRKHKSYSVFKNTEEFHLLRNHCVTVTRPHELLGHKHFVTDCSTILRNYIFYVDLKINAGTVFS